MPEYQRSPLVTQGSIYKPVPLYFSSVGKRRKKTLIIQGLKIEVSRKPMRFANASLFFLRIFFISLLFNRLL